MASHVLQSPTERRQQPRSRESGPSAAPTTQGLRLLLLFLLVLAMVAYASSFSSLASIQSRAGVLGAADPASYTVLLRNFSFAGKLGDEWATGGRTPGDQAQNHKIHHVVYAAVGAAVYQAAQPVFRLAGLPPEQAVFAVNALVGAVNLALLYRLLIRNLKSAAAALPFLVFYAVALSTWIFNAVPDPWPFTATIVLLFLLTLQRERLHTAGVGLILGIGMLTNLFLATLLVLFGLRVARDKPGLSLGFKRMMIAGGTAALIWVSCLGALSLFDGSFNPANVARSFLHLRQFAGADLPRTDPYVWMSAATNIFVNSVVSNQPDPSVPQEALRTTLLYSTLGLLATMSYTVLMIAAAKLFLRRFARRRSFRQTLLWNDSLISLVWSAVILLVTALVVYPSGFLHSTVVVPALVLFLAGTLDLQVSWQRTLLYTTLLLVFINNAHQVMQFREALVAMSQ